MRHWSKTVTLLQARYYDEGYLNVHVGTPRVSMTPDRRYIDISIPIDEGPRYTIGRVQVREVERGAGGRAARRASAGPEMIRTSRRAASSVARRSPETSSDCRPTIATRAMPTSISSPEPTSIDETRIVDLTFQIERGDLVYIERINIRGNEKTRDRVIRAGADDRRGRPLQRHEHQGQQAPCRGLGYFEKVELSTRRGSRDDQMEINIEVTERPTGTFQVGAGFSSQESFILTAQVSQQNLFGRGQSLSLQGQLPGLRQLFQLQFTEPYFLDTKWILTVNAFNMVRVYEDFGSTSTGGSLGFGYPVLPDLRLYLSYTGEYVERLDEEHRHLACPRAATTGPIHPDVPWPTCSPTASPRAFAAASPTIRATTACSPPGAPTTACRCSAPRPIWARETEYVRWQAFTRWYFPLFWNFVLRINLEGGFDLQSQRTGAHLRALLRGRHLQRARLSASLPGSAPLFGAADLDPNRSRSQGASTSAATCP